MLKLVCLSAKWCSPCKVQEPIIEDVIKKFSTRIENKELILVLKLDVDNSDKNEVAKYQVHAVPTTIIERDGVILHRFVGVTSFERLKKFIEDEL